MSDYRDDPKLKKAVWNKGTIHSSYDKNKFRLDACGAIIAYDDYQDYSSDYGWVFDHTVALSKGGPKKSLSNLNPMHVVNNHHKSAYSMSEKQYWCKVTKKGNKNVRIK